ncbi:MAG: Clp protease N-terminal domain-containing protein [Silvibacterium sp.]
MFERYTKKARRVVYFARYEASEFGTDTLGTDLLLLGLLQEDPDLGKWLGIQHADLRETLIRQVATDKKIPTSVDMPMSAAAKQVFADAKEEAERMASSVIRTEHLLLGLLREQEGRAARLLEEHGGNLGGTRVTFGQRQKNPQD